MAGQMSGKRTVAVLSSQSKIESSIDFEEIEDRLLEMVDSLKKLQGSIDNIDLFKIILSAYCVEKAKLLSILYPLEDRGF